MTTLDTLPTAPAVVSSGASEAASVPFKAVLLYEDVVTARRAAAASLSLAAGLHPGARVSHSAWRFDLFDQPRHRAAALAEAIQADAVIASAHAATLPAGVSSWLDEALAGHVGLIVILLSGSDEDWTITIRHTPGFSAATFGLPGGLDKTFRCGRQPAALPQSA